MTRYCIGVDFGTLSARAVLVNVDTGEIVCTSEYTYSKGVIEGHFLDGRLLDEGWALQDPMDSSGPYGLYGSTCSCNPWDYGRQ